jgi:predicted metal-binding transcription factor (methanogenesis marker protein 9)
MLAADEAEESEELLASSSSFGRGKLEDGIGMGFGRLVWSCGVVVML